MSKRLTILSSLFILLLLGSCSNEKTAAPLLLKTEYSVNPLGLDTPQPRFSWALNDSSREAHQTAYQVLVASSQEILARDEGDQWNSGKIKSSDCQFIAYQGEALKSANRYFWKVRCWNGEKQVSEWSAEQWFETALLQESDWKAPWISTQEPANQKPPISVYVRKEFELREKPVNARIYCTGLGNYIFYLNGKRVGEDLLSPGWTDYFQKIQYQVYDITELLDKGNNAAGALLGNMWWSSGLGWNGGAAYSRGPLSVLAQIEVGYADGSHETFVTGPDWKYTFSPITFNHIYDGEHYDARMEIAGWNEPGLNDESWKNMQINESIRLKRVAQQEEPIRVSKELIPVSVTEPKPGIYVFDLGQNMVGTSRIKVTGKEGDQLEIRYAELLHPDGTVAQENLRSARVTDFYTLKSGAEEHYTTTFTYHGFRYVQVKGMRSKPTADAVTGLVFYSNAPNSGNFECSNSMINTIYKNIRWGQISNMMSVPTDCPQRDERLGWMGDAQLFAPTANFNMNMNRFFAKWEKDIIDGQDSTGAVTDVNPPIVVTDTSKPGWGDAVVAIPYQLYRFYGDKRLLEESYDAMMNWVTFMEKSSKDYIYEWGSGDWGGYGDWVAVVRSPTKPTGALYYYYSTKLLAEMAAILGKKADADRLNTLLPKIAEAYQAKYYLPDSGHYIANTQTMNLLPVGFGITPEKMRGEIMKKVVEDVVKRDTHLTTGFMGTAWILPLLSEYGQHELAYRLATQTTYPSWGYMVEQGATTMWELWNSDKERPDQMNSRNHFAYGSVGEWFYQYLAGIRPDMSGPGFKKSIIAPMPAGDLTSASASLQTGYGELSSNWKKDAGSFSLQVRIPANTSATVVLPVPQGSFTISEGGKLFRG
ncbi:MAG: glycoside hydrolase family 78 protein [Bacteroidales bacterium]